MWSAHVLLKYWALQVAGWLVVFVAAWFAAELFAWPKKIVWLIVGVWAAKDALLYPLVWRAYDQRDARGSAYPDEGAEGVVLRRLAPEGLIRVGGERWKAVAKDGRCVDEGARVRIVDRDGMMLGVVAVESPRGEHRSSAGGSAQGNLEATRDRSIGA
jgi:membrane protein implicated in regulation of membrane protease activity